MNIHKEEILDPLAGKEYLLETRNCAVWIDWFVEETVTIRYPALEEEY